MENTGWGSISIRVGNASVSMNKSQGGYHLFSLRSNDRYKGEATKVLTVCKRICRRLNKPLTLTAAPFDDMPMDTKRLVGWYSKRGFVPLKEMPDGKGYFTMPMEYRA